MASRPTISRQRWSEVFKKRVVAEANESGVTGSIEPNCRCENSASGCRNFPHPSLLANSKRENALLRGNRLPHTMISLLSKDREDYGTASLNRYFGSHGYCSSCPRQ